MSDRNAMQRRWTPAIERLEERRLLVANGSETEENDALLTADHLSFVPDVESVVAGSVGKRESTVADVDLFRVELAAGDTIRAHVRSVHDYPDIDNPFGDVRTKLILFDNDGQNLRRAEGTPLRDPELDQYVVPLGGDGTYYLGVSAYDTQDFGLSPNPDGRRDYDPHGAIVCRCGTDDDRLIGGYELAVLILRNGVVRGTLPDQRTDDAGTLNPFSGVMITVPGSSSQEFTVSITLDDFAKGRLANGHGFVETADGTYRFVGTAAEATTAIRGLVFAPTANRVPPGFSETTQFTISVSDDHDHVMDTATTVIAISVNDPPALGDSLFQIDENRPDGSVVGVAIAKDPDAGDPLQYSIVAGNTGDAFRIDEASGQISVASRQALDFEVAPIIELTVQVQDAHNLFDSSTVTVQLEDVNESPTIMDQSFTVTDTSAPGTLVGNVLASDPDTVDEVTFSIVDGNPDGALAIDAATAEITVANTDAFDFRSRPAFELLVRVEDQGGLFDSAIINVSVTQGPLPVAEDDSYSVEEDGHLTLSAPGVMANDTGANDDALVAQLIQQPQHGIIDLSPDGSVAYTPSENFRGMDRFTYQTRQGRLISNVATVTIAVVPVNDPPALTTIPNVSFREGDSRSIDLADFFSDAETSPDEAMFLVVMSSSGIFADMDPTNRVLNIRGEGDFRGSGVIEILARDTGDGDSPPRTVRQTLQVWIDPVNDPPVLAGLPDLALRQGNVDFDDPTPQSIDLDDFFTDVETASADAAFQVIATSDGLSPIIDPASHTLVVHVDPFFSGEGEITVRVTDTGDGGAPPRTAEATIHVFVAPAFHETEPNDTRDLANPISLNTSVIGTFGQEESVDLYAVKVEQSGRFTASIQIGDGSNTDPELTLFGPDRQVIISSGGDQTGNAAPLIRQHLPPGIYYLEVAAHRTGQASEIYEVETLFAPASTPFEPIPVDTFPSSIATGQFNDDNGDGVVDNADHQDLVVANQFADSVSVLLGLGDGTYRGEVRYAVDSRPATIVVGDFDNDGHGDLAVAHIQDQNDPDVATDRVSVLRGDGGGSFTAVGSFEAGVDQRALVVGDFDGDGNGDLAVALASAHGVAILTGNGDGSFLRTDVLPTGENPEDLVSTDFNGDGHLDLVVVNRTGSPGVLSTQHGTVRVLLGRGDGTFLVRPETHVGMQPTSVAVGDLNGDSQLDLAVANFQSDDVSLLFGLPGGAVQDEVRTNPRDAPTFVAAGTDLTSHILVSDFSGDGNLDLAYTSSIDDRVSVAVGAGDGTFSPGTSFAVAGHVEAMVAGDFNGDTRRDIATTHFLNWEGSANNVSVLLGVGDGSFQTPIWNAAGDGPAQLVAGDFNNDGWDDLATANQGSDNLSVLLSVGDGTLQTEMEFSAGDSSVGVATADFNRDGRADLAVANLMDATVSFHLGIGDGSQPLASVAPVGDGPIAVIASDINGDGFVDVASANAFAGNVSILLGRGDGTFDDQRVVPTGDRPDGAAAVATWAMVDGDFNRDGFVDLAVVDAGVRTVSILLGHGDGTFGLATRFGDLDKPHGIVSGDFTADGIVDLAVTSEDEGTIHILAGVGDGTFVSDEGESVYVGNRPVAIVASDFNRDGLLDFATANQNSHDLSVVLQSAGGTFSSAVSFDIGRSPSALVALDVNRDGRVDLATANGGSDDVTVLLGDGQGGFVPPNQLASRRIESTPWFADFNGDGTDDSAIISRSGEILLRLGRPDEPGIFDAARIINPNRPAQSITVLSRHDRQWLAAIDRASDSVSVYSVARDGTARVTQQLGTGVQPVRIAAADLNADRQHDLVVAHAGSDDVSVFLARADGSFELSSKTIAAADPSGLDLRDVNGDAAIDIVVTDQVSGTLSVLLNQGSAEFAPALRFAAGTGLAGFLSTADTGTLARMTRDETVGLAFGDFTENGHLDLATVNRGANSLSVLVGNGTGSFADPRATFTGSRPSVVRAGHFNDDNRDGRIDTDDHLDLAVLNQGSDDIGLYLGDGRGAFTETARLDAGNAPTGLSIHDVDHDGFVDLVVGNEFGDVMTLRGYGNGKFETFMRLARNVSIAVGDLDGDGRDDWVVANESNDLVGVEYGQDVVGGGDRQLQDIQRRDAGGAEHALWAPGDVEMGDLNQDGALDMVVANSGGNNVLVYLGTGSRKDPFDAARPFFAGTRPVDVTIQDVDGDTRPDVVVTNEGSNDVSVLLGVTGEVLLRPGVRLDVGRAPLSTGVEDVNQDGTVDLLVTNSGSDSIYVMPGLGGGFFDDNASTVFPTGNTPGKSIVGQFDGLPGLDLVTLDFDANRATLYPAFNPNLRLSFDTGGIGPIDAVATDLFGDGTLDLIIGHNRDGAMSLFVSDEGGLSLAKTSFFEDLQHPTAMALADLGEQQELALMVADEGDDLVRIFNNLRDFMPGAPLPVDLPTRPLEDSPLLAMADIPDSTHPLVRSAVDARTVAAGFEDFGSAGHPTVREWHVLKHVVDAVVSAVGQQLVATALGQWNAVTGEDLSPDQLVSAVAEVFRGTPHWLVTLRDMFAQLTEPIVERAADPSAVDQAMATDGQERPEERLPAKSRATTQEAPEATAVDEAMATSDGDPPLATNQSQAVRDGVLAGIADDQHPTTIRNRDVDRIETDQVVVQHVHAVTQASGRSVSRSSIPDRVERRVNASSYPLGTVGASLAAVTAVVFSAGVFLVIRRRYAKGSDPNAGTNKGLSAF